MYNIGVKYIIDRSIMASGIDPVYTCEGKSNMIY